MAPTKRVANIQAVLLDADGVVQTPMLRMALTAMTGSKDQTEELVKGMFNAEFPCLTGQENFSARLEESLRDQCTAVELSEMLSAWTTIEPNEEVLALVAEVRSMGVQVVIASSQEPFRADYMRNELGYARHFDQLFFSCDVGYIKPDPNYFAQVLEDLSIEPSRVLFVDDSARIVEAASELGLVAERFNLRSESVSALREILTSVRPKTP